MWRGVDITQVRLWRRNSDNYDPLKGDYSSLAVSHNLVTVKETRSRNCLKSAKLRLSERNPSPCSRELAPAMGIYSRHRDRRLSQSGTDYR
jgi:hypothetical protein